MPMAAEAKSAVPKKHAAADTVAISAKLRKANPWFETVTQAIKDAAVKNRRKAERAKGPELEPEEAAAIADELEELQRQINPLETRRRALSAALLAHWAHTGIEELEHPLGKTLISTSFELALDPDIVRQEVSGRAWMRITERIMQAGKLLGEGKQSPPVRDVIEKASLVRRLKVSVTPPSSRRPKSGAADEDGDVDE